MTEIVAVDLGGTNARFALADIADGKVTRLDPPVTLHTAEHASFELAWAAFGEKLGRALPRCLALGIAAPVEGDVLKLTNSPWVIRPAALPSALGLDHYAVVNDFGAIGHAVAHCGPDCFQHICGPERAIGDARVTSIVGPGTGLGVGLVVRTPGGPEVIETEGGHVDFAPLDTLEDQMLVHLRTRFRRVSVERVASGPGLANIHAALAAVGGTPVAHQDDASLWKAALEGSDQLATAALDRFCLILGAIAGDAALTQGAHAVVLAGGLGQRLASVLPRSGFGSRFVAKGRFEARMAGIPVKLITHPQPGLLGAALAFAAKFPD